MDVDPVLACVTGRQAHTDAPSAPPGPNTAAPIIAAMPSPMTLRIFRPPRWLRERLPTDAAQGDSRARPALYWGVQTRRDPRGSCEKSGCVKQGVRAWRAAASLETSARHRGAGVASDALTECGRASAAHAHVPASKPCP